jgi:hypothetical protein
MLQMGFEPTIPVYEQSKVMHSLAVRAFWKTNRPIIINKIKNPHSLVDSFKAWESTFAKYNFKDDHKHQVYRSLVFNCSILLPNKIWAITIHTENKTASSIKSHLVEGLHSSVWRGNLYIPGKRCLRLCWYYWQCWTLIRCRGCITNGHSGRVKTLDCYTMTYGKMSQEFRSTKNSRC